MICKLDINEYMQVTQVLTLTAELFVIIIYLELKVGYSYNFSCEYFSNNALFKDISMKESLLSPTSIHGLNIEVTLVLGRSSKVKYLELGRKFQGGLSVEETPQAALNKIAVYIIDIRPTL